jgi:ribosomal protein S18 acetylase RimI-like enzyme
MEKQNMEYEIIEKTEENNEEIKNIVRNNWGSEKIVSRGKIHNVKNTTGIMVIEDKKIIGIGLYEIKNGECEIVLLETFKQNTGIGTKIIEKIKETAKQNKCKRLWLVTSNDNINALKFYQKRGFVFKNIYINEMENARKLKPEIPLLGNYGIPIKDEIEFEMIID